MAPFFHNQNIKMSVKMRDYVSNSYCDFLWINDLLELEKNSKNIFIKNVKKGSGSKSISVLRVKIFGTIVEIRQIGRKGFLYHVDDGTGVVVCKHNEEQFEDIISLIEQEENDVLNQTVQLRGCTEQSTITDTSLDDSVFNDKSVQIEELELNKRNQLMGLHSLWNDIYESFSSLIYGYKIGDVVLIEGKLYSYFNVNQIYVNNIRLLNLAEEIILKSVKLEDGCDKTPEIDKSKTEEKRLSGLMTFDHIHHLNATFPSSRNITTPKQSTDSHHKDRRILTPHLESIVTFDTFTNKK